VVRVDDSYDGEEPSTQIGHPEEIIEHEIPSRRIPEPVIVEDTKYKQIRRDKLDRTFYFLGFLSLACLGAVVLSPHAQVAIAAGTIWSGAVALSRHLLKK
jgi:hypothetical protein